MNIPGLGSPDNVDRIDSGSGFVHEHSIEIGETVIVFRNIGSITIINGSNNPWPVVLGVFVILFALGAFAVSKFLGFVLLLGGIALCIWGFIRPPDVFLSIGTCDGRRTHIVSKDRDFLLKVRKFLQQKIDSKVFETGTINITARTITGGVAVGAGSQAAGASGTINA